MIKYVTPLLILVIEVAGLITNINKSVNFWFTIGFALLLAVISIVVYFIAFYKRDTGTNADELAIGVKTEEKVEANA